MASKQRAFTSTEVAERLGCTQRQVERMCEQGRFDCTTSDGGNGAWRLNGPSGHWRIHEEGLAAYHAATKPRVRKRSA